MMSGLPALFATGVVASPGIAASAVDAAAVAAVSFRTSDFFSSKTSIVFSWFDGSLATFENTLIERIITARIASTAAIFFTPIFCTIFIILYSPFHPLFYIQPVYNKLPCKSKLSFFSAD